MTQPLIPPLSDSDFRFSPGRRVLIFCLVTFIALMVTSVLLALLGGGGEPTARSLRLLTVMQDTLLFVVPPVITALYITSRPAELLEIDRGFTLSILLKVALLFISMMPLMNLLVEWNASLTLPPSLSGVEQWMRRAEETAAAQTDLMLSGTSVATLIVNLLIVAVMAGVSEELFFRAGLQRLLSTAGVNVHVSVWATAFIFSAVHLQFFGFFPRLILGALFGYLLVVSGSVWLSASAHVINNAMVVIAFWRHSVRAAAEGVDSVSVASIPSPDIINPTGSTWGYVISAMLTAVFLLSIFKPISAK